MPTKKNLKHKGYQAQFSLKKNKKSVKPDLIVRLIGIGHKLPITRNNPADEKTEEDEPMKKE